VPYLNHSNYQIPNPPPRGFKTDVMPIFFSNIEDEVNACCHNAAIFDYSFLLRIEIKGLGALGVISTICARNFNTMPIGSIRYALFSDEDGWLISDLTVWRTAIDTVEVMSGRAEDIDYIKLKCLGKNVILRDLSDGTACIALQGPATNKIISQFRGGDEVLNIAFFKFADIKLHSLSCRVGRIGYTGLEGIEILCSPSDAGQIWSVLKACALPSGFIAADRLRLRAGLPLFSKEFHPPVGPADVGLSRIRPGSVIPARVRRLCFSANLRRGKATDDVLREIEWSPQKPFPPKDSEIAITSIQRNSEINRVVGMGYAAIGGSISQLSVISGELSNINVNRCF